MRATARAFIVLGLSIFPLSLAFAGNGSITIDTTHPGARIPSSLYGIFFEEISHAGEGGLYSELIQNRGFEHSSLPPACHLENNSLVPPRTPHFWTRPKVSDWTMPWDAKSRWPGWSLQTTGGNIATIDLVDVQPLNEATPHALQVDVTEVNKNGRVALVNDGFWGISVVQGEEYRLSFYARAKQAYRGPVTASLEGVDGRVLASAEIKAELGVSWEKYQTTLRATASDPKARFVLTFGSKGRIWLDFVSLFPARTFKNRANGLRPDIAEMIAGLKPAFIRWPGGCYLEGLTIESRPQWKKMVVPVEERPGTYSPWGYWSTDGFGYHEFLQFSEDVGADALLVANVGVSCAFRSGTYIRDEDLPKLIQDTLDAIEYAIGPVDSKWGAVRAKNGHPRPFPLKYVEIGNEQQGARYGERVAKFRAAIKAKHPQIKVALSSWIAGIDQAAISAAGKIDIVDEHAYKPLHWAVENFDSFSKYKRGDWDLYIGEFATNAGVGKGNLLAALNDSAYMMSMEKNSDLVKMGSYAPLLENVNKPDWEVNLIRFDSSRAFGRGSYYAAKLFAENRPDVNLTTTVHYQPSGNKPIVGRIGIGTYNTAAEFKDIRVERDGKAVYQSDFAKAADGWASENGSWLIQDGAYRQKDETIAWSYFGDKDWSDITVSLKARKLSGDEGVLVSIGYVDERQVQWNVGGWGNRQHAIQAAEAIVGKAVHGAVETNRWYDLKIEVKDRHLRCYLDGVLTNEQELPRVDTVLAISGRDEATGDIILKVVNTSDAPASMALSFVGDIHIAREASAIVLTSANPTDENSFENPTKIAPIAMKITGAGPAFTHEFAPYSLSVIRLKQTN